MNGGGGPSPPFPEQPITGHRMQSFPGMEYNLGNQPKGNNQVGDGLSPMYDMNPHFGPYPPTQHSPFNGHMPPAGPPILEEGIGEYPGSRHQLMNNRLKSLIQSRQNQKDGHGNYPLQSGMLTELGPATDSFSNPLPPTSQPMSTFPHMQVSELSPWNQPSPGALPQPQGLNAQNNDSKIKNSRPYSRDGASSEHGFSPNSQPQQPSSEEPSGRVNGVNNYGAFYGSSTEGTQETNGKEESFDGQNNFSPSSSNSSSGQSFPSNQQQQQPEGNEGSFGPRPFSPSFQKQSPPFAVPTSGQNNGYARNSTASPRQSEPRPPSNGSSLPSPRIYEGDPPGRPPSNLPPGSSSNGDLNSEVNSATESNEPQPFLSNTTTSMNTFTSITNTYNVNTSSSSVPSLPSVSHLFGSDRMSTTLAHQEPMFCGTYPSGIRVSDSIRAPRTGGGPNSVDGGRIDESCGLEGQPSDEKRLPPSSHASFYPGSASLAGLGGVPQHYPPPGLQEPGWWERLERLRNNTKLDVPACNCFGEEEREYHMPNTSIARLPAAL